MGERGAGGDGWAALCHPCRGKGWGRGGGTDPRSARELRPHAGTRGPSQCDSHKAVAVSEWKDVGSSYGVPGKLSVLRGEIWCNYPEGSDPRSVSHNTDPLLGADREITGCVLNKGASFLPSGSEDEVLRFEEKSVGLGAPRQRLRGAFLCAGTGSRDGVRGEGALRGLGRNQGDPNPIE